MKPSGAIRLAYDQATFDPATGYTTAPIVWVGGPLASVALGLYLREARPRPAQREVTVGDVVTIGCYRVRVIQSDHGGQPILVTRTGLDSYLIQDALRLLQAGRWVASRLLMTAAVWGLARWPTGQPLTWTDIGAVRWLQRCYRRTR